MTRPPTQIRVSTVSLGRLGLALSRGDPGGCNGQQMRLIPTIQPARWADDRAACTLAHHHLSQVGYDPELAINSGNYGPPEDDREYELCTAYRGGYCSGCPPDLCLFLEHPESPGWRGACSYRRRRGGGLEPVEESEVHQI